MEPIIETTEGVQVKVSSIDAFKKSGEHSKIFVGGQWYVVVADFDTVKTIVRNCDHEWRFVSDGRRAFDIDGNPCSVDDKGAQKQALQKCSCCGKEQWV